MKKPIIAVLTILLTSALIFNACAKPPTEPAPGAPTEPAEVIKMRFANFFPPTAGLSILWEDFGKEIAKRTDGRVEITYYPSATLLKDIDMAEGVNSGLADMGFQPASRSPGRFPVMESISVLLGQPTGWVAGHEHDDFYREFKPKEFDDFYMIAVSGMSPLNWWFKKPIYKPEDIKGLKIRQTSRFADVVSAMGATPVFISTPDLYDSLAKGVVDGTTFPFEGAMSWRTAEQMPYASMIWEVSTCGAFIAFMNLNSYKNLPPDIQEIWDEVSAEWVDKGAEMWNNEDTRGLKFAQDLGVTLIAPKPEDAKLWVEIAEPILRGKYFEDMLKLGFSEQEVQGWFDYHEERMDYWLKKQIELGIKSPTGPPEVRLW